MILQPLRSVISYDQVGMAELIRKSEILTSPITSPKSSTFIQSPTSTTVSNHFVKSVAPNARQRRRRSVSVDELYTRRTHQKVVVRSKARLDAAPPRRLAPLSINARRMSLEEVPRRRSLKPVDYTPDEYTKFAMETKSVMPFCKIAYPEFTGGYPDLPLQPLKETSSALL